VLTALLLSCSTTNTPTAAGADLGGDEDTDSGRPADTASDTGADPAEDSAPADSADTADTAVDTGPVTAAECFANLDPVIDYAAFDPVMGSHCKGTNYQAIEGVERVVFVGDSVTVGTPPTSTADWYRNVVAADLAARWGLEAPASDWQDVDVIDGVTKVMESGDFASCAKWGARTDDIILDPHLQVQTCIPEDKRSLRTLVVMTVGGNDLMSMLQDLRDGVDEATLEAQWDLGISDLRDAVHYMKDDASMFPGGLFLVFANIFDVTDVAAANDIAECDGAVLIGLDDPLRHPLVAELGRRWNEEALALAMETESDMIFLGETFCGRGYNADDADGRCYRGGSANYYDLTCAHPSADGHAAIADLFLATVLE
jgi:lysophospholipase L1-like esterase